MYKPRSKAFFGLGIIAGLLMIASDALALEEHWAAYCNDGQRISYTQTVGGKGDITVHVRNYSGTRTHNIVLVDLQQTFKNNIAICGRPKGNETRLHTGEQMPIAQICMNVARQIISVDVVNPDLSNGSSGVFCTADVRVWTR